MQLYSSFGVFWIVCCSSLISSGHRIMDLPAPGTQQCGLLWHIQLAVLKMLGLRYPAWFIGVQLEELVTLIPDFPAELVPEHCLPWTLPGF